MRHDRRLIGLLIAILLCAGVYLVATPPAGLTQTGERFSVGVDRNETKEEALLNEHIIGSTRAPGVRSEDELSPEPLLPNQQVSWRADYHGTEDRFTFAVRAAEAAMQGDPRAQYFLGRALRSCYREIRPIQNSGLEPEEYLLQFFAEFPYAPSNLIQSKRRDIQRCERFLSARSLTRFSIPPDPQEFEYWLSQAVANEDILARMEEIQLAMINFANADEEEAKSINSRALSAVRAAVASKEPAAIAGVGAIFWSPDLAESHSFQGPAWILAACELGYGCTAENPDFMLLNCDYQAACPTFQDVLMRDYGAEYGKIYAASQDILYKIQNDDWEGLQQYLQTKPNTLELNGDHP